MFKRIDVLRTAVVLGAALLVVLQTGCAGPAAKAEPVTAAEPAEIPITTASEEARAVFLEGREIHEHLRIDEAREYYDKAIELDPDFALAYWARAMTAPSIKNSQEHLSRAMALAPKVSEGERLMIEANHALWLENNPPKALELREQLVGKYPSDKRAHNVLAPSYAGQDQFDKAIAEYEKAIDIDKDFAPPYNSLGYAYIQKGEYDNAEEAFKNYIRLIPEEANPYDSMADLYTRMGRHEEATEHYQKAAELNPLFAVSQRKIGLNLVYMGRYAEGRAAYDKALEMEPTPWDKVVNREMTAFSYLNEGNYQQALAELDMCVEMAAEADLPFRLALIHSGACRIHIETGNLDQAEQSLAAYRTVIQESDLSPSTKDGFARRALFQEAFVAAKRTDFEGALAKAEELKAKIAAGENPMEMEDHHKLLGLIYLEKGEPATAVEHLEQADQEDPHTVYLLAVAESESGDEAQAAELFNQVAQWNEVLSQSSANLHRALGYALVRAKALAAVGE